jgi:hypothetical protein
MTVMTQYPFQKMFTYLTLIDDETETIVATEDFTMLDIKEKSQEEGNISLDQTDMVSYIQVPKIQKGTYTLKVDIYKQLFLNHGIGNDNTCLNFDLQLEYVAR